MTSRLIPSGEVAEISENWSGQANAFAHADGLAGTPTQPITEIAGWNLIEINDVGVAAIDREIT